MTEYDGSPMTLFAQYQSLARDTATKRHEPGWLHYIGMQIASEAGEVAGKIAKGWRDDGDRISPERREALILELGDVLWYASATCDALGIPLSEVARRNIVKLRDRAARGAIHGDGDNR